MSGGLTLEQVRREKDRRQLARVRTEKARRKLRDFVRWAWPVIEPVTTLRWGWHLDAICEHLQAVSERQIKNLLVNIPPGCLKSTTAAVCWHPWHWIEWPEDRFVTASYREDLAIRDAGRARRIIESPQYQQAWGGRWRFVSDQNEKTRYENDKTGVRLTTSVGGGTGDRGDFTLLDDPHNVEKSESHAALERTKRWHDEAFWSRINDQAAGGRVVIGHRVGPKDLSGHLKDTGLWTHLRLPEEYNPKRQCVVTFGAGDEERVWVDPRKGDGELLRPATFALKQVADTKKAIGAFAYAAQHNQEPVPREGALYKLAWFANRRFTTSGDHYVLSTGQQVNRADCRHFAVCDPAGGTSDSADHTALGVFACTATNDLLVLSMERGKPELQAIPAWLKLMCDRWPGLSFLGIEDGFFQNQLIDQAKKLRGMVAIKALSPGGRDKVARSIPALTRAEAGQIYLPESAPWLEAFGLRLAAFTGAEGGEDDEADVLAYMAQVVQDWDQLSSGFAPRARGGLPR